MDSAARLVAGRTFVPLRFVAEALGASVRYEGVSRTVQIYDTHSLGLGPEARTLQEAVADEGRLNGQFDINLLFGPVGISEPLLTVEATTQIYGPDRHTRLTWSSRTDQGTSEGLTLGGRNWVRGTPLRFDDTPRGVAEEVEDGVRIRKISVPIEQGRIRAVVLNSPELAEYAISLRAAGVLADEDPLSPEELFSPGADLAGPDVWRPDLFTDPLLAGSLAVLYPLNSILAGITEVQLAQGEGKLILQIDPARFPDRLGSLPFDTDASVTSAVPFGGNAVITLSKGEQYSNEMTLVLEWDAVHQDGVARTWQLRYIRTFTPLDSPPAWPDPR